MVHWLCNVVLPSIGIASLAAGLGLHFTIYESDFSLSSGYIICGSVLLGLVLWNAACYRFFRWKVENQDIEQFPGSRNILFRLPIVFSALPLTLVISWPLGWLIQLVLDNTFGWIVSKKTRLYVNGRIFRFSSALFSVWLNPFWSVNIVKHAFIMTAAIFPTELKFVATAWIFKIPFGGWMSRRAGDLPIKFKQITDEEGNKKFVTDKNIVKSSMTKAGEYLNEGLQMGVFPEGSLSKSGELQEFKDGFFRLAIETEASITPIGMWGNQTLWLHGKILPQPGYAEVAIGEPIEVRKSDDLVQLKEKVKSAILELRNGLPLYQKTKMRQSTEKGKPSQLATHAPENVL